MDRIWSTLAHSFEGESLSRLHSPSHVIQERILRAYFSEYLREMHLINLQFIYRFL